MIPFVRIAHCQRGSYFKVKGNLILISANVPHSLSKVLPKEQNLLPVCFKRKMEYKGNYLEEIIDKNKVNIFFDFYKKYNPHYADINLNEELIDEFEIKSKKKAESFESAVQDPIEVSKSVSVTEPISEDEDSNSETEYNDFFDENVIPTNLEEEETHYFRDQSTVFCNKYEEDVRVPSVANKMANMIVHFEITNNIDPSHYRPDKVDINDEINLEEIDEFQEDIDMENTNETHHPSQFTEVKDEICEEMEESIANVSKHSKEIFSETLSRIEKISVAPGEKGKFQNWGEDVFLEEKCFPELFPFGTGG